MSGSSNNLSVLTDILDQLTQVRSCLTTVLENLDVEKHREQDKLQVLKGHDQGPMDQEVDPGCLVQVIKQQTCKLSNSLDGVRLSNTNIAESVEKELSQLLLRNSCQKQRIQDFSAQLVSNPEAIDGLDGIGLGDDSTMQDLDAFESNLMDHLSASRTGRADDEEHESLEDQSFSVD